MKDIVAKALVILFGLALFSLGLYFVFIAQELARLDPAAHSLIVEAGVGRCAGT